MKRRLFFRHFTATRKFFHSIACLSFLGLVVSSQAVAEDEPREITVMADAVYAAAPDHVQIAVTVSQLGKTAKEAEAAVEARVAQIQAAVKQLNSGIVVRDRARFLTPSSGPGIWKPGSLVQARRILAVETSSVGGVAELCDLLLQKGADSIDSLRYSVRNSSSASGEALKIAATRAKEKAETVAKSLHVGLGPLVSLTETIEPGAEVIRQRMELGESPGQFSDEELHVVVSARFGILPGPP